MSKLLLHTCSGLATIICISIRKRNPDQCSFQRKNSLFLYKQINHLFFFMDTNILCMAMGGLGFLLGASPQEGHRHVI